MALSSSPSRRQGELGFATVLLAVAGLCFIKAAAYPGASGTYPKVLSILLGIGAVLAILRALRQTDAENHAPLVTNPGRCLLGFAALAIYVGAIDLLGYILPSFALVVLLPLLLGYRDLRMTLLSAAGGLSFILLVFAVILERPLPADLFDPVLEMLR
ncbi:tripartite tricarboxylate transporter TctB family protein [Gemmobacter fulvus]|uniref:tripartite tricarboxylate transporter TctB family protein n=1 Tax=Gemmobacter fulvus TaxID=2840474 RepID=UPI0027968C89|nr:tripartite tricarboxylate transporter TctB family protein [Gemmobacter fulvus]MDQ1849712.1 tripartite tricarboxylate transporter TctB family protein [Gemmobacter fulvus]